jgi:3-oxoadipate enol-lactonase
MRIGTPLGDLYVDDIGEGPVVVLWHSYLHHGGMWRAQVEALRGNHRILNIDAPGHGRSSIVHRAFDMADCVRCVEAVMDARKVERAAFVGLSWGGMVAMAMAIRSPQRLTAIVPMDTSARREPLGNRLKYIAMGSITRKVGVIPAMLDRVEPLFFSAHTRVNRRAELVEPWRSYVSRLDRESVWNALQCIFDRNDLTEALRRVTLPTMVIVGAEDTAQPVRESEHIASAIPGARLMVIPGAAHISTEERPKEVNTVLGEFLSRHIGGANA